MNIGQLLYKGQIFIDHGINGYNNQFLHKATSVFFIVSRTNVGCNTEVKEKSSSLSAAALCRHLLLHDFQNIHGADLGTNATGNALGCGAVGLHDHNLHGACFHALAAADTQLLVDHVNAGLGILGNGAVLTDLHALAALNADNRLCALTLGNNLDAGQVLMKLLIESVGTGTDTLQACHALDILLNSQLLHNKSYPFS
jgi:hypothetical protein